MTQHVPVLMYHSIATESTPAFADFVVPPEVYAAQISALARAGWRTKTMTEAQQAWRSAEPLDKTVVLTFDDGFADFASTAMPVLTSVGFTATLYVTTRFVGGSSRWLAPEGEDGRRMLSWSELAEVAQSGIEIGAHSDTHPHLDLLRSSALARELSVPKRTLEDRLGREVRSMAYPFGYATRKVREMTAQLGYDNAVIVGDLVAGPQDDPYAAPRLTVTREHDPLALLDLLESPVSMKARASTFARRHSSRTLRRIGLKKPESAAYSRGLR